MTPTLFGRWQTRLFLFATVGVLITLPFAILLGKTIFFFVLLYLALLGLIWDILYIYLQKLRWDRDWPGIFQLAAGLWEALFFILLVQFVGLANVTPDALPLPWFILHYSLVWLGTYIASQTLMRIMFPRWRFRGGQLF
ncbi:MAG: hypothetical protein ACOC0N_08915 [Chroococcales cyanobacterium]